MNALPAVHLGLEALHGKLVTVIVSLTAKVAALDDDAVAVPGALLGAAVEVECLPHLAAEPGGHVHPALARPQGGQGAGGRFNRVWLEKFLEFWF